MANYVFAYSGGNGVAADEAKRTAQLARWGQWVGERLRCRCRPGAPRAPASSPRQTAALGQRGGAAIPPTNVSRRNGQRFCNVADRGESRRLLLSCSAWSKRKPGSDTTVDRPN